MNGSTFGMTVFLFLGAILFAGSVQAGTYGGGSGTAADPYQIWTAEQMNTIGLNSSDWGKCFKLMADIDMSSLSGTQFNMMGRFNGTPFTGTFDGNRHVVANLTMARPSEDHVGLFGNIGSGGKVKNLGLENVSVIGHLYVGCLAGVNNHGSISASYASGTVSGTMHVGGLVGLNQGAITADYYTGTVAGSSYVSGLVGSNYGDITSCYSTGTVTGSSTVGGLVGYNQGVIIYCFAAGRILCSSYVGGLVGLNQGAVPFCFWDKQTTGQQASAAGEGKTTAEMKILSTFTDADWDFFGESANGTEDTWRMCADGINYPRLSWQFSRGGDLDCPDGVELEDLMYLAKRWMKAYWLGTGPGDIDGSGSVNLTDYVELTTRWTTKPIPLGTVTVDGNLSEWVADAYWYRLNCIYNGNPMDIGAARFALRWNETTNKIYAAVVIPDTNHVLSDSFLFWNASDRIEVHCQATAAGGLDYNATFENAQKYYVAPNTSGGAWACFPGNLSISNTGLEFAVRVSGNDLVYEVGVTPFEYYGGPADTPDRIADRIVDLKAGEIVGFDLTAITCTASGYGGMVSENLMREKYRNAGRFAKYILE